MMSSLPISVPSRNYPHDSLLTQHSTFFYAIISCSGAEDTLSLHLFLVAFKAAAVSLFSPALALFPCLGVSRSITISDYLLQYLHKLLFAQS